MATVFNVASYFLAVQDVEEGDITNLKLQKLCSYAQAVCLMLLDRPLFNEYIQAWKHGPVIPELYEKYKSLGKTILPTDNALSEHYAKQPFDDEEKFILEFTNAHYGAVAAWDLREMSHTDFNANFGSNQVIDESSIRESFSNNPIILKQKEEDKRIAELLA